MGQVKIKYDDRVGRIEIYERGDTSPRLSLNHEDFANLLEQVFAFVEQNSPHLKKQSSDRWQRAFGKSVRREAWTWLGGAVKEKIKGYFFKPKQEPVVGTGTTEDTSKQ